MPYKQSIKNKTKIKQAKILEQSGKKKKLIDYKLETL